MIDKAANILPWRERVNINSMHDSYRISESLRYAEMEIADLRAALKAQPAPSAPVAYQKRYRLQNGGMGSWQHCSKVAYEAREDSPEVEFRSLYAEAQPAPTEAEEPVAWFEAEPSAKGLPLREVIGGMVHSTRWHTRKPNVLNNALWPLYEHPTPTEAQGEDSARVELKP